MKRILFVDDELQVLDGLRNALRKHRKRWDMVFVTSGEEAVAQLDAGAFELVISDMRMPVMDGAELLRIVREKQPRAARVILSGQSEPDALVRALPVTQQFLSKPCDPDQLLGTLERLLGLQELVSDPAVQALVGGVESLPALPATYMELTTAIADPGASIDGLAAIVERDSALSVKILQLANSSFFGASQRTGSIRSAVSYLGLEMLRMLTLTARVFEELDHSKAGGLSLSDLQSRSMRCARIARRFVAEKRHSELAFSAALLRDIGMIVLASGAGDRLVKIFELAKSSGQPFHLAERELGGATHAEVGGFLLGTWGLPYELVEVVAYHHTPAGMHDQGSHDVLAAVHAADVFVEGTDAKAEDPFAGLDLAYLERTNQLGRIPEWKDCIEELAQDDAEARAA